MVREEKVNNIFEVGMSHLEMLKQTERGECRVPWVWDAQKMSRW